MGVGVMVGVEVGSGVAVNDGVSVGAGVDVNDGTAGAHATRITATKIRRSSLEKLLRCVLNVIFLFHQE
jgi:tetrahydrodipicolinate N-succinyltransferase